MSSIISLTLQGIYRTSQFASLFIHVAPAFITCLLSVGIFLVSFITCLHYFQGKRWLFLLKHYVTVKLYWAQRVWEAPNRVGTSYCRKTYFWNYPDVTECKTRMLETGNWMPYLGRCKVHQRVIYSPILGYHSKRTSFERFQVFVCGETHEGWNLGVFVVIRSC